MAGIAAGSAFLRNMERQVVHIGVGPARLGKTGEWMGCIGAGLVCLGKAEERVVHIGAEPARLGKTKE